MRDGLRTTFIVMTLITAGALPGTANAQTRDQNLVSGEASAKELLLLMDKDKNGKVSRQEFMDFMAGEFDRLDVNHDGELDVKELKQMHYRPLQRSGGRRG